MVLRFSLDFQMSWYDSICGRGWSKWKNLVTWGASKIFCIYLLSCFLLESKKKKKNSNFKLSFSISKAMKLLVFLWAFPTIMSFCKVGNDFNYENKLN